MRILLEKVKRREEKQVKAEVQRIYLAPNAAPGGPLSGSVFTGGPATR